MKTYDDFPLKYLALKNSQLPDEGRRTIRRRLGDLFDSFYFPTRLRIELMFSKKR